VTPEQAAALIHDIDTCRGHFSGSTPVPYADRHRIHKPPMSGAPEAPLALLARIRAALEQDVTG
jgi:hypothetical protein